MQQLQKSVGLLYQNYNARERDDVVFLHTGDVTPPMQQAAQEEEAVLVCFLLSLALQGTWGGWTHQPQAVQGVTPPSE